MILELLLVLSILLYIYCKIHKKTYQIQEQTQVLLTGACMGLGKQIALQLAHKKCILILIDIRDDLSQDLLDQIRNIGCQAYFYKCNLSNLEECKTIIKQINNNHKIQILINNAGIGIFKLFIQQSYEEALRTNSINYLAPVIFCKELLNTKSLQHIVNIGSAASVVQGMKITSYSGSKHQLWGFHNCLRAELKYQKSPVITTLIAPWGINTGMVFIYYQYFNKIQGLKTKLDYFFPIMSEQYVAKCIIESIEQKREIVFIPWYQFYVSHISRMIPSKIVDWFIIFVQAKYMDQFVGRNN